MLRFPHCLIILGTLLSFSLSGATGIEPLLPESSLNLLPLKPTYVDDETRYQKLSDGRVVIFGNIQGIDGFHHMGPAMLNSDGSYDDSWNSELKLEVSFSSVWGIHPSGGEFFLVNTDDAMSEAENGLIHLIDGGNEALFTSLPGLSSPWVHAATNDKVITFIEANGNEWILHKWVYNESGGTFQKSSLPDQPVLLGENIKVFILGSGIPVLIMDNFTAGGSSVKKVQMIGATGGLSGLFADSTEPEYIDGALSLNDGGLLVWGRDSANTPLWYRFSSNGVIANFSVLADEGISDSIISAAEFADGSLVLETESQLNFQHNSHFMNSDGSFGEHIFMPFEVGLLSDDLLTIGNEYAYYVFAHPYKSYVDTPYQKWNRTTGKSSKNWLASPSGEARIWNIDTSPQGRVAIVSEAYGRYQSNESNIVVIEVDGSSAINFMPPLGKIFGDVRILSDGTFLVTASDALDNFGELGSPRILKLDQEGKLMDNWYCPLNNARIIGQDADGNWLVSYPLPGNGFDWVRVVRLLYDGGVDYRFIPFEAPQSPIAVRPVGESLYFFGSNQIEGGIPDMGIYKRNSNGKVVELFDEVFGIGTMNDVRIYGNQIMMSGNFNYTPETNIALVANLNGGVTRTITQQQREYFTHFDMQSKFLLFPGFLPDGQLIASVTDEFTGDDHIYCITLDGTMTDVRSSADALEWDKIITTSGRDGNVYLYGRETSGMIPSPRLHRYSNKEVLISLPFETAIAEETLSVTASVWQKGSKNLNYRWLLNGRSIRKANSPTLVQDSFAPGTYTFQVRENTTVLSGMSFEMVAGSSPVITQAPESGVYSGANNQSMTAYVNSPTSDTTVRWFRDGELMGTYSQYDISPWGSEDVGNYYFIASNPYGEVRSESFYKTLEGFSPVKKSTTSARYINPESKFYYIGEGNWWVVKGEKVFKYSTVQSTDPKPIDDHLVPFTITDDLPGAMYTSINPLIGIVRYAIDFKNNQTMLRRYDLDGNYDTDTGEIVLPSLGIYGVAQLLTGELIVAYSNYDTTTKQMVKFQEKGEIDPGFLWTYNGNMPRVTDVGSSLEGEFFSENNYTANAFNNQGLSIGRPGGLFGSLPRHISERWKILDLFGDGKLRSWEFNGTEIEVADLNLAANTVVKNWEFFENEDPGKDYLAFFVRQEIETPPGNPNIITFKYGLAFAKDNFAPQYMGEMTFPQTSFEEFHYDSESQLFYFTGTTDFIDGFKPILVLCYDKEGNQVSMARYFDTSKGEYRDLKSDGNGGYFLTGEFYEFNGFKTRNLVHLNEELEVDETYTAAQYPRTGTSSKIIHYSSTGLILKNNIENEDKYLFQAISSSGQLLNEVELPAIFHVQQIHYGYFDDSNNLYLIDLYEGEIHKFLSNGVEDSAYLISVDSIGHNTHITPEGILYFIGRLDEFDGQAINPSAVAATINLLTGELLTVVNPPDITVYGEYILNGLFYFLVNDETGSVIVRSKADGSIDSNFKIDLEYFGATAKLFQLTDGRLVLSLTDGEKTYTQFYNSDGSSIPGTSNTLLPFGSIGAASTQNRMVAIQPDSTLGTDLNNLVYYTESFHPIVVGDPYIALSPETSWISFNPVIVSKGPVSYQWERDGSPILGANSDLLELNSLSLENSGQLTLTVSNDVYSYTSNPVSLLIYNPLEVLKGASGDTVTLTALVEANSTWKVENSSDFEDWTPLLGSPFQANSEGEIVSEVDCTVDTFFRAQRME